MEDYNERDAGDDGDDEEEELSKQAIALLLEGAKENDQEESSWTIQDDTTQTDICASVRHLEGGFFLIPPLDVILPKSFWEAQTNSLIFSFLSKESVPKKNF